MTTSKAGGRLESTVADPDDVAWAGERPGSGHIGRYEVRGTLGSGGMGIVVAAHDPQLDRNVAIKILPAQHGETARLFREAKAMARLSHPNVVTVHEVVAVGDRAGIVMELVDGEDLATWSEKGPREWREVIGVYVQAARGLAAAHGAGIVHRDFKPSNVLIGKDGIVRVSDFGLARSLFVSESELRCGLVEGSPSTITRSGVVVGTPAYMAPEQHEHGTVDERTDQWAFACSLYEALFGERPFGDDREGLRDRVLRGEIVEPDGSNVPRAIRVALRRALEVKPDHRFASMDELIAALMAPMVRRS
ncbi:MAG TPA: serine/threonine-protein kinase, partial [Kofleriaceae bacterium]|nr:serine/threonine-protein kinase [Kofleriaceae bacterium]